MIPLAQLLTAPTAASTRAAAVGILESIGIPASSWRSGGVASSLLTATTSVFASVIASLVTTALAAPFLPISPPPWISILAKYVYGVIPVEATFASGTVSLTNPGGGTYNIKAGQLAVANSFTGTVYTNVAPFTLGPTTTLAGVEVQANILGSVGNASAGPGLGSIDTVVSTNLFPGVVVTVVNLAPVEGLDGDLPTVIRQKCLAAIAARSYFGPNGAYQNAIVQARNGTQPVNVNRWSIVNDPSTGEITAYLASPAGAPTALDVAAVQVAIDLLAQPQGITATATPCTVIPLSAAPQTVTVWATGAGIVDPIALLADIEAAIDDALAVYPISGLATPPSTQGYLYASFLDGVVKSASPRIYNVVGFVDVPLLAGQVAERTSTTTIRVRLVVAP